ncbi:MAG: hypothetical protein RLY86_329 [Pseudomonadota bacterium]|jgi:putative addiction module component (TIGR02574 family)
MSLIDFSHLTREERLQLIEELWDSLDEEEDPPDLTPAQRAELDRRLATLDQDAAGGRSWEEVRAELKARYL